MTCNLGDLRHIRKQWRVLVADGINDDIEFVVVTGAGLQFPCSTLLVVRTINPGIQLDMRVQVELCSTPCKVGLNLWLFDKALDPPLFPRGRHR